MYYCVHAVVTNCTILRPARTAARSDVTMSLKYGDSGEVPSSDGLNPAANWLYA